jgi:pilus assembly protein CpaC
MKSPYTAAVLGLTFLLASPTLMAQGNKGRKAAAAAAAAAAADPVEDDAKPTLQDSRELNLSVGENTTIPASDIKSFSEGIRGIADIKLTPDNGQFVIAGQRRGTTTLLLIKKDGTQVMYTINVSQRPMPVVERELNDLLQGGPGVRIRRVGSRFFIDGGVSTEQELKRIEQIAALYPDQVQSLVVVGGAAAERRINIRIDFFFVQYDKSRSWNFGVRWPGAIGPATASATYDFVSRSMASATVGISNQPLLGLDAAASNGWAKVMKHSTVITSNGTEADFESGGEQNFVVSSGLSTSLNQIKFGTNVHVLPRFDPISRELEVHMESQVMDLTPPISGTSLPGRNVSKLDTRVALKLGQSIVLSGIRTREQRHAVTGVPLLSEIPVLGVLFGSHSDAQDEVEGAIFVVPSVIESVPRGAADILKEALNEYDDYSGDVDDVRIYPETPSSASGLRPVDKSGKPRHGGENP